MTRLALTPLAALAAVVSQPAVAEVIEAKDGRFVTRDSVTVKATPRETWLALISPGKWWSDSHTWSGDAANMSITPQGGGCFCERIPEEESLREVGLAGSAQHMTVVQAQPMSVLRMRGGLGPLQSEPAEGVLTIALQEQPAGGTKMVWEYVVGGSMRYEYAVIAKAVDGVLSEQMNRLADLLGRDDSAATAPAQKSAGSDATEPPEPGAAADEDSDKPPSVEDELDAMEAKKAPDKKSASDPR